MKAEPFEAPVFSDDEAAAVLARNAFAKRGAEIAARRRAEGEVQNKCESAPDDSPAWPKPQPLTVRVEPEPYPVDALPPRIRAAVEEVQGYVQAPLPMVASSALAALSVAIQAYADVQRDSHLSGPVSLFVLIVADSGERKTTCDGFFMRAIRDYEREQAEAALPELARQRAELAAWEPKASGIKDRIRQDSKAGKPTARLEAELVKLEAEKPEPPRVPRLLYSDVTPEQLAWALAHGWPAGGVVSAEAGTVFGGHGMSADSVMRNLSMLNQLWDGCHLAVDRRTSESFAVRGARLSSALQTQETTLRAFFEKAGPLVRGSGFMARFLVAWPQSTQGTRLFVDSPEHWPHMAGFNQRITEILNQAAPLNGRGGLEPQTLTLSPEARAAWIAFHDAIEVQLASGGELFDVRDVASKSADNAARLDGWLVGHCGREHTLMVAKSHVLQHGPLRKAQKLDDALKLLTGLDRVRVERIGRAFYVKVNPAVVSGGGDA